MDSVVLFEIEGSMIHQIVQIIVRHHWQMGCRVGKSSSNYALGILVVCVVNSESIVNSEGVVAMKVLSTVKAL